MIYFVDDVGPSPSAQSVALRDLPLRDVGQHSLLSMYNWPLGLFNDDGIDILFMIHLIKVLFISERMVIGVGFDCNPMLFTADDTGLWYVELLNKLVLFSDWEFLLLLLFSVYN